MMNEAKIVLAEAEAKIKNTENEENQIISRKQRLAVIEKEWNDRLGELEGREKEILEREKVANAKLSKEQKEGGEKDAKPSG